MERIDEQNSRLLAPVQRKKVRPEDGEIEVECFERLGAHLVVDEQPLHVAIVTGDSLQSTAPGDEQLTKLGNPGEVRELAERAAVQTQAFERGSSSARGSATR